jgi:hypothetical protein
VGEGAVVIVEVELGDARAEEFDGGGDAGVGGRVEGGEGEVEMADVEADADGVEVAGAEDVEEVVGGGDLVLEVFEEEADAEGGGESLEVLDGGERVVDGGVLPGVVAEAEV